MAKQILFTPPPLTPKPEFRNRMPEATEKRTEALLAAIELLEVAREHEAIDLLQGIIGAKTTIIEQIAEFASKPEAVNGLRNLIILAKIVGDLDGGIISNFVTEMKAGPSRSDRKDSAPSLWQLARHADHPDVRRGLSFVLHSLEALGRAVNSNSAGESKAYAHANSKA